MVLKLADREHIMTFGSQGPDYREIAALICEEMHPGLSGAEGQQGFVGYGISGVVQRRTNVFGG